MRLLFAFLLLLAGLAPAVAQAPSFARMTAKAADGYIVPAYAELARASSELVPKVEALCAGSARIAPAELLRPVVEAWAKVDFLRFGPMTDGNRLERFSFWPDPKGTGLRQLRMFLNSDVPVDGIAGQSAAIQGLPALELLLTGELGPVTDARRCATAVAVARNMALIAREAHEGWSTYRDILLKPGAENPLYRSDAEAATEILKALSTGYQQLREQRIVPALGKTVEEAKPRRAPYYRSGLTLDYLGSSVGGLQRFGGASGIAALLPKEQDWIAGSIDFECENLNRAFARLSEKELFESAANRQGLAYAVIVLNSLQDLYAIQLSAAVKLSPGFNALDGD